MELMNLHSTPRDIRKATKTGIDVVSLDTHERMFTYGKITLLKKSDCIVLVSAGPQAGQKVRMPLEFPCVVNGVGYDINVPAEEVAPEAAVVTKKSKAAPGETKIAKCRALFALHPELDKAAMVGLFVGEVGCTPAGANTYYLTCKKG